MIHFELPFFLLIATLACLWFDGNDDGGIGVGVDALMLMLKRKKNLTPISSKKYLDDGNNVDGDDDKRKPFSVNNGHPCSAFDKPQDLN